MCKLIKILSILFLVFGIGIVANTQTCYIQSENNQNFDMTGYKLSGTELADINALCCNIGDLLPNDLKRDFKIYDFGLYKHNKSMEGGYDAAWSEALSIVNATPYYLVFGRMDDNKQYKVALRLPTTSFFECQSADRIKNLEAVLEAMANENASSFAEYNTSEAKVLNKLKDTFAKWKDCCVTGNRNPSCSPCDELKDIKDRLAKEGFREQPCKFVSNTGNPGRSGSRNSTTEGETNMIVNLNGVDVQLNADLLGQFAQFEDLGITSSYGYIASDKYFCDVPNQTKFDAAFSTFNSNASQFKVMYVVVDDPDSANDFLFTKYLGQDYFIEKVEENILSITNNSISVNYSGCHGTNKFVPIANFEGKNGDYDDNRTDIGWLAHSLIQTYYKYTIFGGSDDVYLEYAIPEASKNGYTGYADIVNKETNEIWEIKSVNGALSHGDKEVQKYVDKYNIHCIKPGEQTYTRGQTFPPVATLPWVGNKTLWIYKHQQVVLGGVISYKVFPNGGVYSPNPVPVPTWQVIKEVLDRIKKSTKTAKEVVNDYLREYPHTKPILIFGGSLIAAAALTTTLGTGGSTIVVTASVMALSVIIVKEAWSFTPPGPSGGA